MACNNKLTIREALKIQAGHLKAHAFNLTLEQERELRNRIQQRTFRGRKFFGDLDAPLDISTINDLVPRGYTIVREARLILNGE